MVKQAAITFFILLCLCSTSFATWSIIIIDPITKEIGIAGASCTSNCYGIGEIAPGKGAIIVQAMSNNEDRAKGLQMIISESDPTQIIEAIRDTRYDPEKQQYAVVTLKHIGKPGTYTGKATQPFNGALTARGISVQGNTLASRDAFKIILDAALNAQKKGLSIDAILMAALKAGAAAGGDKRCGSQKAMSAFITVAKPNDKAKKPYLELIIFNQEEGGQNAVTLLRRKYDKWKAKHR